MSFPKKICKLIVITTMFIPLLAHAEEESHAKTATTGLADCVSSSEFDALQARSYSGMPNKQPTKKYYTDRRRQKKENAAVESWKPFLANGNRIQPPKSIFFQTNIGIGFLYFSGVKGNLMGTPPALFNDWNSGNMRGRLQYNRTPLYEYILGYRFCPLFKAGISYLHQGNVSVQTKQIPGRAANTLNTMLFSANLALDAIMAKVYFEFPWPLLMKNTMTVLYAGSALGPGWQTWNNMEVLRISGNTYQSGIQPVRQRIAVNAVWMMDLGFRTQGSTLSSNFSVVAGCKFNLWGNSRRIGKIQEQGSLTMGLVKPFKIKHMYQWSPYLGVQWNFPDYYYLPKRARLNPGLIPMETEFNVGPGLLYFKRIRGNLLSDPKENGATNYTQNWIDAPIGGELTFNRTPLFEYLVQHRFNDWWKLGVSYQNQGGITVKSRPVTDLNSNLVADYSQFTASLNLNALLVKGFFSFPDIHFRTIARISPYFGLGFGPSWQSWSRIGVLRTVNGATSLTGGYQPVRQKISANVMLNLDWGFRVASTNPNYRFSFAAGCKYNMWGQARHMGQLQQQGTYKLGLLRPVTIRSITQWAPYLGVQWTFPNNFFEKKPYFVEGKTPNTWVPFIINIDSVQRRRSFFTQFSTGIGFLYFRQVRGNIAEVPATRFLQQSRDVPVKGRLTYNRTPLFEYQLGYRFFNWFKTALSYQHQGNISIQTKPLQTAADSQIVGSFTLNYNQFSADLLLDAIMGKVYFEWPKPPVWRSLVYTPFLGLGTGASWQTWKRVNLTQPIILNAQFESTTVALRPKTCANVAFMFDLGVRMQSPYPDTGFSTTLGLKFNVWGQTRNLGKITQSDNPRIGVFDPVSIKTIYQWSPYVGVQWNF